MDLGDSVVADILVILGATFVIWLVFHWLDRRERRDGPVEKTKGE